MIKQQLEKDLKKAVGTLGFQTTDIVCDIAQNPAFGDYTSNIALQLAKQKLENGKQSPNEIAKEILSNLGDLSYLEKAEIAGPGFINFFLKPEILLENLHHILDFNEYTHDLTVGVSSLDRTSSDSGKPTTLQSGFYRDKQDKKGKVIVEFAHPNTHKAFHIGHLRNISTGESIVRLLESVGYEVIRANYEGDVGMHIAKAIYALMHIASFNKEITGIEDIHKRVEFLGKAYAAGSKAFEEDEEAQKTIKDINFLVYASAQKFQQEAGIVPSSTDYLKFVEGRKKEIDEVFKLWKETRQWSLDYFETIYKRVHTHFDRYYFESECLAGVDKAKEAVKKGVLKESDGAIIFDGEPYSLDTRVFVNSLGLPTYEGKELALAEKEFSEFGQLSKLIHVVGPEQSSFFKVTFKVEELLDSVKYKGKQFHLAYGWVRLKQGKMSSRTGDVVLGEWLLDEAKAKIKKKFPEMDEKTLEMVAVGAVKYSMLKFSTSSEISFSFEDSISLQGDSGPYLQYAYSRAKSVLGLAQYTYKSRLTSGNLEKEEREILRIIEYFDNSVEEAAANYAPHIIAQYLINLAKIFNLFYQKHRIIKAEEKTELRLDLTYAVASILEKGLYLLGIEAPERM